MKKIFYILTAALLLTGCTVDDTAIDNNASKTVTFTATLAPKGGGEATRNITVNNQNTSNETLTTAWKSGEKIALYYQTGPDTYAKVEATVGTPNADGTAPINATLENAMDGGSVKFVYPASLHDGAGDINESILLNNQNGLLRNGTKNISKNFDAATGLGTLSVGAGTAVTSEHIAMENRVCICKIELSFSNGSHPVFSAGKTLTINVGNERTYTISSSAESQVQSPDLPTQYEPFKTGDVIYVAMLPVVSQRVTFLSIDGSNKMYKFVSNDVDLAAGKFYRNIPLTLTQMTTTNRTLTASDGVVTLQDGDVLSGTGGANTQLKIADGATVILNGVTNTDITQEANIPGIDCLGDATIILEGENSVRGREYAPGIFVPEGKTLTIMGSGTLNATGGNTSKTGSGIGLIGGAGIGGTKDVSCGNIVIKGGTITATGTGQCAGIGSGYAWGANNTCGDITISGGTVTATGDAYAAGIGSGDNFTGTNTCGAITITGGMVTATSGDHGAGIGSGHAYRASNTCGAITISGGTVTATGGALAAGIGSGNGHNDYDSQSKTHHYYVSACGAISITGGTVTATSGDRGAGIGSGNFGRFASISIGSGITRVTATRSNNYSNVPIGGGNNDQDSGAVMFDGVTMHDGTNTFWEFSTEWKQWPEDGQTYGGIIVAVTNTPFDDATWTLTPANNN